ncbi:MAG: SAM-dependent DNA methyltransferase [Spirobacillus cienkowskii]|jgi:type I restriction enzyme M protein|uniref:site-specific DNA-methyltransferase (adenine-specific) n=1 Tax=Spirobacillus cienkowskii TaxID=495820 RepID=A0A369KTE5_9BACT|nr:MAG: SAM-dependent DNA methyltransferase [Spirobacillus cienkowskii]
MPKIKKTPKEEKQKIKKTPKEPKENKSTTNLGFEEKLWQTADKLRAHMDAAVYKHVVLGLVFLKYVSDSFIERYNELLKEDDGFEEEKDAYSEKNVFWVPKNARWDNIKNNAKKPEIGKIIDDAMNAIEKENRTLKGVLQKDYARPDLDKRMLGELVDLISSIELGDKTSKQKDLLGRVYEYFLGKFASAEGKLGGQFYTPGCIVKLLVEMIEPLKGRIYDPCCGSGGMFVQSIKFLDAHGGKKGQLSIYGQESNPTTWKLCKMNLAIRGLEGDLGEMNADTFHNDQHRDLKADYILANPPFNISDWGGEMLKDDQRWRYGVPSAGNANYAWLQHMVHRLAPNGVAGIVLANGSLSSNQSSEGEIRKKMLEADIIDCIISLPGQLFYSTQIPASLWFISRNKKTAPNQKNRSGKVLFIDCRKMGIMTSRVNRELTDSEIKEVGRLYHAWRGEKECGTYQDKAGFCKSVTLDEIEKNGWVLTPGRYVGAEDVVDDEGSFEEKFNKLKNELIGMFKKTQCLAIQIENELNRLE